MLKNLFLFTWSLEEKVIAIIRRTNDNNDVIKVLTEFQERFFHQLLYDKKGLI